LNYWKWNGAAVVAYLLVFGLSIYASVENLFDSPVELADCYYELREYNKAMDVLKKLLTNVDLSDDIRLKARFLLGKIFQKKKMYVDAAEQFMMAYNLEKDPTRRIDILKEVVGCYTEAGIYNKIGEIYSLINEEKRKIRQNNEEVQLNKLEELKKKGVVEVVTPDTPIVSTGEKLSDKGNTANQERMRNKAFKSLLDKAQKFVNEGKYPQAYSLLEKSYKLAKNLKDKEDALLSLIGVSIQVGHGLGKWLEEIEKLPGDSTLKDLLDLYPSPYRIKKAIEAGNLSTARKLCEDLMRFDSDPKWKKLYDSIVARM